MTPLHSNHCCHFILTTMSSLHYNHCHQSLWRTMECSHAAVCTNNQSRLVVSSVKAFPGRPRNSGFSPLRAATLDGSVIRYHHYISSHSVSAPASQNASNPLEFVPHLYYPQPPSLSQPSIAITNMHMHQL